MSHAAGIQQPAKVIALPGDVVNAPARTTLPRAPRLPSTKPATENRQPPPRPGSLELRTAAVSALSNPPNWWDYSDWGDFDGASSVFGHVGDYGYGRGAELAAFVSHTRYIDRYGRH